MEVLEVYMGAPVLDDEARAILRRLRRHAEANPFSKKELLRAIQGRGSRKPPGLSPDHAIRLPFGWKVIYSIEDHGAGKKVRHLSVSVAGGRSRPAPNPDGVRAIARELGFKFAGWEQIVESPTWGWRVPNVFEEIR